MAQLRLGDVEIAWQQLGDGPDLVLVHGLAASRAFWFGGYALPLSRHFRVTIYDLRGHGYSSTPAEGYGAADQARDLLRLLDALDIPRATLVGHSYGGGIVLEAAIAAPARVAGLALLDTRIQRLQPQMRLHDSAYLSPFERRLLAAQTDDWEQEEQVGIRFLEAAARWRLAGGDGAAGDITPFGEGRGAGRSARAWLNLIARPGLLEQLTRPGADPATLPPALPTLLLYGEHSRCLPSAHALLTLRPTAQLERIAGGGHFFPLSHVDTVRARLETFAQIAGDPGCPPPRTAC
jgi:Predicted hydrolases or acyltransferases (alpha/beta hydrolase superfamily)